MSDKAEATFCRCSTLREKCPYSELFCFAFSRIRTEYGEILRISRIQSECGKMRTTIAPNTDTFHAVLENSSSETLHKITGKQP